MEDFLGEAIAAEIGPFVALGNPVDSLPPDGATREYAPDASWKERFAQLSSDASCIVLALGESENLQWELNEIRKQGMSQKLCVFTPPLTPRKNDFGALRKSVLEAKGLRETQTRTWAAATGALRRAGFDCDAICPGTGAAVVFDEPGKSTVLTTEASTPDEYVRPVADWIKSRTKSGRHIAGDCPSCGARVYQAASGTPVDAALCFICRGEAKLAGMSRLERTFERFPALFVLWVIVSLVIAAFAAAAIGLPPGSTWLVIVMWALVLVSPWILGGLFRSLKRAVRQRTTAPPDARAGR